MFKWFWTIFSLGAPDFLIKVLKSPRRYDFLKQIDLDDIVDKMKKFQELRQQSMINDKFFPDLQAFAGKSCNHRSRKRFFSAARRLKTRLR